MKSTSHPKVLMLQIVGRKCTTASSKSSRRSFHLWMVNGQVHALRMSAKHTWNALAQVWSALFEEAPGHNGKVAFRGFLLIFVFSWKFLTPIRPKLCKNANRVGTAHCNVGPERYRGGTAHWNRGPKRHRGGTRIALKGASRNEVAPRWCRAL